jgi:hypothetical protein
VAEPKKERDEMMKKRGPKPKRQRSPVEQQQAQLEQEIESTIDLIARQLTLTTGEQQAMHPYLSRLAKVAAALTVLSAAEQEAIKNLCLLVLRLSEDAPMGEHADTLRKLVRATAIGEQVYRACYLEQESREELTR